MKKKLTLFILLITLSTICMGIGYAAVDNVTLELSGNTSIKKSNTLKITSVEYKDSVNANLEQSKINSFSSTTINSKIVLGNNLNSTISYEVILENNSDNTYKYVDTIHDNSSEFYDNDNIEYEVKGITAGEKVLPDDKKTVTITFKYKKEPISNNTLNSYINIKFVKVFNIEYINIDENNLIDSIEENKSTNIQFLNAPDEVEVTGDLDYTYNNGILSISNVTSDIKITGKNNSSPKITTLYTTSGKNAKIGSTINPNDYQQTTEEIEGAYIKYTVDSNNKVTKIEGCKTSTANAKEVCLIGVDADKYSDNKDIITAYFKGSSNNLPKECTEEDNSGTTELTCTNSYVVLAADDDGGIFINDIENHKSCVINPTFGIYSCE